MMNFERRNLPTKLIIVAFIAALKSSVSSFGLSFYLIYCCLQHDFYRRCNDLSVEYQLDKLTLRNFLGNSKNLLW
jgi:hypothetical protein